ncbi:MAG: hypothetical protein WCO19_04185 [Candidatus Saccharibacteria bacterium]
MLTAQQLQNNDLFINTAKDFTDFSTDINVLLTPLLQPEIGDSHRFNLIGDWLSQRGARISRTRRFPLLKGKELDQLRIFEDLFTNCSMNPSSLVISCRQRGGRFIMTLHSPTILPFALRSLIRSSLLEKTLVQHLNQVWIKHYSWILRAKAAGLSLNMYHDSNTDFCISFYCVQQMSLPLFDGPIPQLIKPDLLQ